MIEWVTVQARDVVTHFVQDYVPKPEHWEWFFDAAKGEFVLKLYVRRAPPSVDPDV